MILQKTHKIILKLPFFFQTTSATSATSAYDAYNYMRSNAAAAAAAAAYQQQQQQQAIQRQQQAAQQAAAQQYSHIHQQYNQILQAQAAALQQQQQQQQAAAAAAAAAALQQQQQERQRQLARQQQQQQSDKAFPGKMTQVKEFQFERTGTQAPYKLQKALIDQKIVPCINVRPYVFHDLMMTLPDFVTHFYPELSIEKARNMLQDILKVVLYKGNR